MAGGFRRNHDDVQIGARRDLAVVNVETVGEGERGAFFDVRFDVAVNLGDVFIRQQNHDDIRVFDRFFHRFDGKAGIDRFFPAGAAFAQTDDDVHAAFVQVVGVGVALRAVADDGDGFALQYAHVGVFVVIDFHCCSCVCEGLGIRKGFRAARIRRFLCAFLPAGFLPRADRDGIGWQ